MLSWLRTRWLWFKERKRLQVWHRVLGLYALVFLIWSVYRLLFRFPVWFEEMVLKGLVFGVPVLWLVYFKERWKLKELGMGAERLFESVYMGLSLGLVLGLIGQMGNVIRHGGMQLSSYGLSSESVGGFILLALVTAFWESLLFFGYILKKLEGVMEEQQAVLITAILYVLTHLPALVWLQSMGVSGVVLSSGLLFLLALGNGILRLRMGNLAAPILAQTLWGVTVFLFR